MNGNCQGAYDSNQIVADQVLCQGFNKPCSALLGRECRVTMAEVKVDAVEEMGASLEIERPGYQGACFESGYGVRGGACRGRLRA